MATRIARVQSGLSSYMTGIYTFMAAGLLLTGLVSFGVASIPALYGFFMTGIMKWISILSPLVMVLVMSFGLEKFSAEGLRAMFFGYAALMGISLSTIFLAYAGTTIFSAFFVTAGAFAGLSAYGLTTKKNLSGWGSFLLMGLIGIILASIVNLFIASSALLFAVNVIGTLIFAGLTVYDSQRLKELYLTGNATSKLSIMGALSLYLNFINLFMFILQFMGMNQE